jgi:hypothetical protein
MAVLPNQKRISREDLKEAPSWIEKMLYPVNSFFESVYSALNKDLTFADNIVSQIKEIQFTTASDYVLNDTFEVLNFTHTLKNKPIGCIVLQIYQRTDDYQTITTPVTIDWIEINGVISINFVTGLDDSKKYTLRVLVI